MKTKSSLYIFPIQGMHCASCAQLIQNKVSQLPSIHDVVVSYATEQIQFRGDTASVTKIAQLVAELGYKLNKTDTSTHHNTSNVQTTNTAQSDSNSWQVVLPVALLLFIVMLYELLAEKVVFLPPIPMPMTVMQFFWWIAASYTLFVPGRQFLHALSRLFRLHIINMDTLIGLGTTTAYAYSTIALFFPTTLMSYAQPVYYYFDVVVVVIGFVLFGKHLESIMKFKTRSALASLAILQAKNAVLIKDGIEREISIEEVKLNDLLKVKHGEQVPLDGVIVEGESLIDESLLTGESLPVVKTVGSTVLGGSINRAGVLVVRTTAVQGDGFLQQIINLVQTAQLSRAPIERLTDTVSRYFVPIVALIAIGSSFAWYVWGGLNETATGQLAIQSLVGVLVIACPCALGLATPAAMVVAMGRFAQHGIFVKDAAVLEKLAKITTLVLDKTGTITMGQPEVVDVVTHTKKTKRWLLGIASALESASTHPLSFAIHSAAKTSKSPSFSAEKIETTTALGIAGTIDRKRYWIGGKQMLQVMKVRHAEVFAPKTSEILLYLGSGQDVIASFVLKDKLKASAKPAINQLHTMGLKTLILSGDRLETVSTVAEQVGIQRFISDMKPDDKLREIKKLESQGERVAMVGDGINDAPALAQAAVGLAMSTGSDSAISTADATILHGDLNKIVFAVGLARTTMQVVRQNLVWAFLYNAIGIPLAAGWLYPMTGWLLNPGFAGIAMALSSVSVVLNSLRLRHISIEK